MADRAASPISANAAAAGEQQGSSPSSLRVRRLHSTGVPDGVSAVLVKLTDESMAAISRARSKRQPIRMAIDAQGGRLEIGGDSPCAFGFSLQPLNGTPTDAVKSDGAGGYRSVATLSSKIQIQATDKTFAETREKTQVIAEEAKKKKENFEKRSNGSGHRGNTSMIAKQKRPEQPIPRPSSSTQFTSRTSPPISKVSSSTTGHVQNNNGGQNVSTSGSSSSIAGSKSTTGQSQQRSTMPNMSSRTELLKKPLRKRVVHMVVTGRFRSADEVLARLTKEGLPDNVKAADVHALVNEVGETGKDDSGTSIRLHLRPAVHTEVDTKWPWFTTDDQARLRRVLTPTVGSTSFVPSRRSTLAPPTARSTHSNSTSPDAPPMPPSTVGKKVSPSLQMPTTASPTFTSKRKADPPSQTIIPDKRPRQQSLSPPEDPTTTSQASRTGGPASHEGAGRPSSVTSNSSKSTAAMITPGSSPSLIDAPKPSRDWEAAFDDLRTGEEAEKYYNTFQTDYPAYLKCFKTLEAVAKDFKEMEKQLKEAHHPKEHEKVERAIQTKFAHYQCDADFLATRQRHSDLRAKLSVLKRRLDDWDRCGGKKCSGSTNLGPKSHIRQQTDNIFVM